MDSRVESFYKINSVKIFFSAEFVRFPFTLGFTVIEVEHRGECADSQTVNMIFVEPEHCA